MNVQVIGVWQSPQLCQLSTAPLCPLLFATTASQLPSAATSNLSLFAAHSAAALLSSPPASLLSSSPASLLSCLPEPTPVLKPIQGGEISVPGSHPEMAVSHVPLAIQVVYEAYLLPYSYLQFSIYLCLFYFDFVCVILSVLIIKDHFYLYIEPPCLFSVSTDVTLTFTLFV